MDREAARDVVRVEALSDGVFAIALTLLSLDLKVPVLPTGGSAKDLGRALLLNWPSYAAFTISFGTILVLWMGHHGLFRLIRKADSVFIVCNGVVLLIVTAVPFPTALVAKYLLEPSATVAVAAYASLLLALNVAYNLIWVTASHKKRLLKQEVDKEQIARIGRRLLIGFPIYLGAVFTSLWNAFAGLAMCLVLWVLWGLMAYEHVERKAH